MMRTMREIAKPVFWVVAITFIGWLAYGQVTEIFSGGRDVVLKVDGREVRLPEYNAALQAAYEQVRRQTGGSLTREDEQQAQNQVVDQLVQLLLLEQQYRKLGITVTNEELVQAAQSSPPPEVMESPEFQTNGRFDITKWQRFIASASDPQFLQSLEARYRQQIPQMKLVQYLTADVHVSDPKLWRIFRDQHESVTAVVLALRPEQIPDQDVPVSDAELQRYYESHKADFKRPAVALLSYIAQPRQPYAEDSAAALARARQIRTQIAKGAKFEDVAKKESADTVSGAKGGDLGWVKRNEPAFDPQFMAALRKLATGVVSQPVLSNFGYHLIRIDAVRGDSLHVRHILVPIELTGKHLDYVEARADTLDKLAAEQTDGSVLDGVAQKLGLPVARARLVQGERMTLGRYAIPDVSVWAFEGRVRETSPVIEAGPAYYVFRLDSLTPGGTPPLDQIRDRVLAAARLTKKREAAERRAAQSAQALAGATNLLTAGPAHGFVVQTLGPFARLAPPPLIRADPLVVGAAFGLNPGSRSGVISSRSGFFLLESLKRTVADSTAWLKQKDQQRESLLEPARQARVQAFLAALRARAKVVDRRKQIFAQASSSGS
jgi:peptidyl-prolyl cis-trans isomerase D